MKITDQTTMRELEDLLEKQGYQSLRCYMDDDVYEVVLRRKGIEKYATGKSLAEAISNALERKETVAS